MLKNQFFLELLFSILNESLISENDEELIKYCMVARFLLFDLSPCLKKGILIVLNECFKNPVKNIEKLFSKLEKEGFLNILIYLYSNSCIDVRRIIIDLIKSLTNIGANKSSNKNESYFNQKILSYLNENLLNFELIENTNLINIPQINDLIIDKLMHRIENEYKKQCISYDRIEKEQNLFYKFDIDVNINKQDKESKSIDDHILLESEITGNSI